MYRNLCLVAVIQLLLVLSSAPTRAEQASSPIKNVLFIISDDLKASVLGCYGDRFCKTPNIDALARRGLVFDRAYCQGTSCAPSRQSLMFSRYKDKSNINLGEYFKTHGWHTARVGKIYHMRVPGDIIAGTNGLDIASSWSERFNSTGLEAHTPGDYACLNLNIFTDSLDNRESTKMRHRMFVSVKYDGDGADQPDHKSATKAIELLRRHQDQRFFLAVGLVRPHYPMVAPRQFFAPYPWQQMQLPPTQTDDLADIPKLGLAGTISSKNPIGNYPDNQKRMWSAYYASVTFMDQQVGRIIDELDRLGLSQNTAVVFTSDHGYHLGEHGFWQKSNLHEEVLRVPMIVAAPGFPAGRTNSIVELVDLYPTLADLAGLEIPAAAQGVSLKPVLRKHDHVARNAALSLNRGYSLRTAAWHFMRYKDGTKELYDMKSDPNEFMNLAVTGDHAEVVQRLEVELDKRLQATGLRRAGY